MLVVISSPATAGALAAPLREWTAAGLCRPVVIMTADGSRVGQGDPVIAYRSDEEDRPFSPVWPALADLDLGDAVALTVALGSELAEPDAVLGAGQQAAAVLRRALPHDRMVPQALVLVPGSGDPRCRHDLLIADLQPWLQVVAEDRDGPGGINTLLGEGEGDHLARHAAHAVLSLANAWSFTAGGGPGFAARAWAAPAGDPRIELVRCFTRVVVADDVVEPVISSALTPPLAWPNPDPTRFDEIQPTDGQLQAWAELFLRRHASTLGVTPVPAAGDGSTRLGLPSALRLLWRLTIDHLRRRPVQWLDDRVGDVYNSLARAVEEELPPGIVVTRWRQATDRSGDAWDLVDELSDRVGSRAVGGVGSTWEDLWRLALGLADGSPLPARVDSSLPWMGERRVLVTDRRLLADDPLAADGDDAAAPRTRSLLARIGEGVAQAQAQARREAEDPTPDDFDELPEQVAVADRATGGVIQRFGVTLIGTATMLGLLLAGAWSSPAPLAWKAAVTLGSLVLGPAVALRAGLRAARRVTAARKDVVDRWRVSFERRFRARVRPADAERLARRCAELQDWAEIIGWHLHHPVRGVTVTSYPAASAIDPVGLPAALAVAHAEAEPAQIGSTSAAIRRHLYGPHWLSTLSDAARQERIRAWCDARGHPPGCPHPSGFSDTGSGPSSLRRHLVESARAATVDRSGGMAADVLQLLAGRCLGELVGGVRPVGAGPIRRWDPVAFLDGIVGGPEGAAVDRGHDPDRGSFRPVTLPRRLVIGGQPPWRFCPGAPFLIGRTVVEASGLRPVWTRLEGADHRPAEEPTDSPAGGLV